MEAGDTIVRYASSLDDGDWQTYRDCFTPDVQFHGFGADVIHGVEAWLEFVNKTLEPFAATQHLLGPAQVTADGDTATLRADLQAQHFFREPTGRIFTLWGTYRSGLARRGGVWRIAHHTLDVRGTRVSDA
jgi:3-phenylpropionate/cinnamic acid dioxygenase small subunit